MPQQKHAFYTDLCWLVLWNVVLFFPSVGNVLIPTDEPIFFSLFPTRNVGSRTRSSQIQKLAWNKLKGKSLQLAFRWGKAIKDVHFLALLKKMNNIE